jgi:hypothetical protein
MSESFLKCSVIGTYSVMGGSTLVPFDLKEFPPSVGSPGRWIHMEREWGAFVRRWGKKSEPEVKDERCSGPSGRE